MRASRPLATLLLCGILFSASTGLGVAASPTERLLSDDWSVEEVWPLVYASDLTLDASGRPHVAFCAWRGLYYGWKDASGWHTEQVASSGLWDFTGVSLALDADDQPRLVYCMQYPSASPVIPDPPGPPSSTIWYAERVPDGWDGAQVVAQDNMRYMDPRLRLGTDGSTHLAFDTYEEATFIGSAWYALKTGPGYGDWAVEELAEAGLLTWGAGAVDLAVNQQNLPVVSYRGYQGDSHTVVVAVKDGVWQPLLARACDPVTATALAEVPDGVLHLLYSTAVRPGDDLVYTLHHEWLLDDVWHFETLGEDLRAGALAVDGAGGQHALWFQGLASDATLYYALNATGSWQSASVSPHVSNARLALDVAAEPHLLYEVGNILRYAERTAVSPTPAPTVPAGPATLWLPLVRK